MSIQSSAGLTCVQREDYLLRDCLKRSREERQSPLSREPVICQRIQDPGIHDLQRSLGLTSALSNRVALSLSLCTKRANSGCVMLIGSPPCFAIQSRRSGPASTRAISLESLLTTPVGVPAGAHIPYQIGKSNPATPASAIVGTSGSKLERRAVVTPSGNKLPSRIGVQGDRDGRHHVRRTPFDRGGENIGDCIRRLGRHVHHLDASLEVEFHDAQVCAGAQRRSSQT